jgi:hypothetical protein
MKGQPWSVPTRRQAVWFWLRSRLLVALRWLHELTASGARRCKAGDALAEAPVRARVRVPLWKDGRDDEFVLTAGKVHNLRLAAKAFDGVEISAGAELSFWRQVGRPSARRGYVYGREIRAGCVVPTVAGGICQLSNALATCAAMAGFTIIERHSHTARIENVSPPTDQLDATVFWNYVDLKIAAPVSWRIDAVWTASELVISLRARDAAMTTSTSLSAQSRFSMAPPQAELDKDEQHSPARGCLTCQETSCFRHRRHSVMQSRTAWLLDGRTAELESWLRTQPIRADCFSPVPPKRLMQWAFRRRSAMLQWLAVVQKADASVVQSSWASLRRALWLRYQARDAGQRQASIIDGQRWLAQAYARCLSPEHTHLVIDQGLLPHLQQAGVLGGRCYDVLAMALPMDEIQHRLDLARRQASSQENRARTLVDFRADPALIRAEALAMLGADRIVTAHADVARHWRLHSNIDVRELSWQLPKVATSRTRRPADWLPLAVFPASALARKGAYELSTALRGLRCRLWVLGSASDDLSLWEGLQVEHQSYDGSWLAEADLAVLPAHVEHAPRALLCALAAGIPVIATPACGIRDLPNVTLVEAGDVLALRKCLTMWLAHVASNDAKIDRDNAVFGVFSPSFSD